MTVELVKYVHLEIGHGGGYKTIAALKNRYFWPGMNKQTKLLVRECRLCQLAKQETRPTVGPGKSITTREVGELIMADLYGPLPRSIGGVRYIFVIQDSFSRYINLFNLKIATTTTVLRCLESFLRIIKATAILTDNGTQFTSNMWKSRLGSLGVKILHSSVHNPGPNITERVNKELGRIFRVYCHDKHTRWPTLLTSIENTYNNSIHCSTGFSPNEVVFGKSPRYNFDKYMDKSVIPNVDLAEVRAKVQENLKASATKRQHYFNMGKRLAVYEVGTLVKLRRFTQSNLLKKQTKKFSLLYEGPYVIGAVPFSNTYTLVDPRTREIRGNYSAIHLARYYINKGETQGGGDRRAT